jgi:hypothetical protein
MLEKNSMKKNPTPEPKLERFVWFAASPYSLRWAIGFVTEAAMEAL